MGIGLSLAGVLGSESKLRLTEIRDWLSRAAVWFEAAGDSVLETRLVRDYHGHPLLHVHFHPVAEPAQIRLGSSCKVSVHAKTTPAGPGYHAHLCELLIDFAEDHEFTWNEPAADRDPVNYFSHPDPERLERHFLHWLSRECSQALRRSAPDAVIAVGIPRPNRFCHPGPVLTPLGPQSMDWLKHVATEPASGRSFFPWWSKDLNADFYMRRALTDLWLAFPWRTPLTEAEGEVVDQIAADFVNAYEANPHAELPWSAWNTIVQTIEADGNKFTVEPIPQDLVEQIRSRDDGSAEPMGYRKFPVHRQFSSGWQMTISGQMAIRREEDGRTWTAWDDTMTVWLFDQSLGHPERGPVPTPAQAIATARRNLPDGHPIPSLTGSTLGEAVYGEYDEEGRRMGRLSGVAASGNRIVVCNIYFDYPRQSELAKSIWQSLERIHDSKRP